MAELREKKERINVLSNGTLRIFERIRQQVDTIESDSRTCGTTADTAYTVI